MSNVLGTLFEDIANAIRSKNGETGSMKPSDFPEKISKLGNSDNYNLALAETMMAKNPEFLSGNSKLLELNGFVLSDGNTMGDIVSYSFAGFADLEYISFSETFYIRSYSLAYNEKLKIADFSPSDLWGGIVIQSNAFYGCNNLSAIIVRGDLDSSFYINFNNGFANNTNSTFFIYVPSKNYDKIISKLNTSAISSSRIRKLENYPEIANWRDNI